MYRVSEVTTYHPAAFLVKWQEKNGWEHCEEIRNNALEIGTAVDQYVQDDILGNPCDWEGMGEVTNCMRGWEKFKKEVPEFFEKAVRHRENMQRELIDGDLMGHPDFIFEYELPDLKTSKSISMSYWMQVSQYAKMAKKLLGYDIREVSILRLDKYDENGFYEYVKIDQECMEFWQKQFDARFSEMKKDMVHRQELGKRFHEYEEEYWLEVMRKIKERDKLA